MIHTINTTATLTINRPYWLRLIERIQGKPSSKTMTVPIVGEAVVKHNRACTLELSVDNGKPLLTIIPTIENPGRDICHVSRVTIREKGTGGRFYSPRWIIFENLSDAAYAAKAERESLGAAIRGVGVAAQEMAAEIRAFAEVAGSDGAVAAMMRVEHEHLENQKRHLTDLFDQETAEAARMRKAKEGTTVANRARGYAFREATHNARASALAEVLEEISLRLAVSDDLDVPAKPNA